MKPAQHTPLFVAALDAAETRENTTSEIKPLRMGVTAASLGARYRADSPARLKNALDAVNHCSDLGAGGVQLSVEDWSPDFIVELRNRLAEKNMFFEGQVRLPRQESDLPRFDQQIRTAREAGASIVRTVALGGRRYETFSSAEAFRAFVDQSWKSFRWAEPIMRRHQVQLAVENHKDWRIPGLLEIVRTLSSEYVGVCVDFGNSISLLEDSMEVAQAYAPFALTTHFKDMAVEVYNDGFLLSEVPLGDGILKLGEMIAVLRKANASITFNLEMITRDPLEVPCLNDSYWPTFPDLTATTLARALEVVKSHPPAKPLPKVTGLNDTERVAYEESNNAACFDYARNHLGFV